MANGISPRKVVLIVTATAIITIIQSTETEADNAVDVDYYTDEPHEGEKQIEKWKEEIRGKTK